MAFPIRRTSDHKIIMYGNRPVCTEDIITCLLRIQGGSVCDTIFQVLRLSYILHFGRARLL
mgnify:CR=1 FL=1